MILTFTANPSLDLLFEAESLVWDDANRIPMPRRRPGGQGINLTRAARALGANSIAIALLGGHTGADIERDLGSEFTPLQRITITGETRTFVGVHEADTNRNLLLNPRGPMLSSDEVAAVFAQTCRIIDEIRPAWFAASGSIPPGVPATFYRDLGTYARAAGIRFVADCDGDALRSAASVCDLLVPNQHEASRLAGAHIQTIDDAVSASRDLAQQYHTTVAIKLAERGAVLSDGKIACTAVAAAAARGSAVGAGDAFLAALLIALNQTNTLDDALADAVAAGTAVLSSKGSDLLCRDDFERVRKTVRARRHA